MGEDTIRRDHVTREEIAAKRDHGLDLRVREVRISEVMSGIGDLDTDRARIDVGLTGP
jgi:hypothetical protein